MPDQLVGMENVVGLLPARVDQLIYMFHIYDVRKHTELRGKHRLRKLTAPAWKADSSCS